MQWLSSSSLALQLSLSPLSLLPPFIQLQVLHLLKENTSSLVIIVDSIKRCKNSRAGRRDRAFSFPWLVSHNKSTATKPGAHRTQCMSNPMSSSLSSFNALLSAFLAFITCSKNTHQVFFLFQRGVPLSSPSAHSHGTHWTWALLPAMHMGGGRAGSWGS